MERKIYISGPITGMPNDNREAFADATRTLRSKGYLVCNPHELVYAVPSGSPWSVYMRVCIEALTHVTDVVMLEGWERSRGAQLENLLAIQLEIDVHYSIEQFLKEEQQCLQSNSTN
ncbi:MULTISPECIES: DUF4406 domain-containing protein [Olivibacter]|jgi:hypothetical protein|uniref:DUF4406 domain-containing protein n=1 Tax=Olivibacter jilunii TaxID=985016 RepID=A0ABW6B052_9SPHI